MAFPVVEGTDSYSISNTAPSTTHDVPLTGLVSGELALIVFNFDSTDVDPETTVSVPAGWTILSQATNANDNGAAVIYRQADGSEGATVTVTTSNSEAANARFYRISGAEDPATQVPEFARSQGFGSSPDPPSLTPTGGEKDYLWFAFFGSDNEGGRTITDTPANYTMQPTLASSGVGGHISRSGWRQLNAASEDPGTFTMDGNDDFQVYTIAVHPAAAATEESVTDAARADDSVTETVTGPTTPVSSTDTLHTEHLLQGAAVSILRSEHQVPVSQALTLHTEHRAASTAGIEPLVAGTPSVLEQLEVWSDVEANDGSRLAVVLDYQAVIEELELGQRGHLGKEELLVVMSMRDDAFSQVREGRVIRVEEGDGDVTEWRIVEVGRRRRSDGGEEARVKCESIARDLFRRTPLLQRIESGRADLDYNILRLKPAEWIDSIILGTDGFPSWVNKGTVESSDRVSVFVDALSAGELLDRLAELTAHEWGLSRSGSTGYAIDVVFERGESSNRPFVGLGRNLLSAEHKTSAREQATRVYPLGGGPQGQRLTIADAKWKITGVSDPNILSDSEDFSTTNWSSTVSPATVTANDATAPDGNATADKVADSSTSATELILQDSTASNGETLGVSWYIKKRSDSPGYLPFLGGTFFGSTLERVARIVLDPRTGETGGVTAGVSTHTVDELEDWWRVRIVATNSTLGNNAFRTDLRPAFTASLGGPQDTSLTGHQHVWGAHVERSTAVGPYTPDPGGLLTLADPAGGDGPIGFDGQLGAAHDHATWVEYTGGSFTAAVDSSSTADTLSVRSTTAASTGDTVSVRSSSSGADLTFLEDPSNKLTYGLQVGRAGRLDRRDLPPVQNLLSDVASAYLNDWSEGSTALPNGWNLIGTTDTSIVSKSSGVGLWRHGGFSARIAASSAGVGLETDEIAVSPTSSSPFFTAQVMARAETGTYQVHIVDASNGDRLYPSVTVNAAKNSELNVFARHDITPPADFNDLGTTAMKVRVVSRGGSATFNLDGAQLLHRGSPAEQMHENRAANALWQAANDELSNRGPPEDQYNIEPIDLYRTDITAYPDDKLNFGQRFIAKDAGIDFDGELRIVGRRRNLALPGDVRLTVDNRRMTLAERMRERRDTLGLADEAPPQTGADRTAGNPLSSLQANFSQMIAAASSGRWVLPGVTDIDPGNQSANLNLGEINVLPFTPTQTRTLQEMGVTQVTTDPGGQIKFLVYSDNKFYPDTLLFESAAVAVASNGQKTITGPIIDLDVGETYWVGVQTVSSSGNAPQLRFTNTAGSPLLGGGTVADGSPDPTLASTGNGATVPTVFPAGASPKVNLLRMGLKF